MTKRTDFGALDAVYPLDPRELYRQWVLARDPVALPGAWMSWSLGGWHLAAHPDAHVCELRSTEGRQLGWVIEPLLYLRQDASERPKEVLTLPIASGEPTEAELERALYGRDASGRSDGTGVQGMWIAILPVLGRLYLGPIHSVVYDPERRIVATSHNLLGPVERDLELSRAFDPLASFGYYSFGLTAFRGVGRLLPGHYLDLDRFAPVRHWPKAPLERLARGEHGAAAMVENGRRVLSGLADAVERLVVPLSAGRDSRAVLALLRPLVEAGARVELFTSVGVDFTKRIDVQAAKRLAEIAGLPHEVRARAPHGAVPAEAVMRNFARIGEAKATPILSNPGTLRTQASDESAGSLTLAGMAGETGRATYWPRGAPERLSAEDLLRRVGAPVVERSRAAAQAWLDRLPGFVRREPADALDLAYVEQRLGCWEANSRYLFPGRPRVISPMASAFCIETMLRLPLPYRRRGRLQRDMVAHGWPELLEVPFNRATGRLFLDQVAHRLAHRARAIAGRR